MAVHPKAPRWHFPSPYERTTTSNASKATKSGDQGEYVDL